MKEAQELLGVSGPKMWRLVRDGDLVAEVDPLDKRRKMLRRSDVMALARYPLDRRRKAPQDDASG